jgi:hypothetical protein
MSSTSRFCSEFVVPPDSGELLCWSGHRSNENYVEAEFSEWKVGLMRRSLRITPKVD